jgi:hypothetical protein
MSKFFSIAALVVGGIIIADILLHPQGTAAASTGFTQIETPTYSALLGGAPVNQLAVNYPAGQAS